MHSRVRLLFKYIVSACLLAPLFPTPQVRADNILAGYDLFETTSTGAGGDCDTFQSFGNPDCGAPGIPGGFFDPGCAAFTGKVPLRGEPLRVFQGHNTGTADTIVQRLADANPPVGGASSVMIPIELVALNLVSVSPITVTGCIGGDQPWSLRV